MPPPTPTPSLDRLRDAIQSRVQESSLRAVAREVGMSPSGLQKFLAGGIPYQKSRRKLFEWLQREREPEVEEPPFHGVPRSLAELVRELPYERRDPALAALVETLRTLYDTHGAAAPEWLSRLPPRDPEGAVEGEDGEPVADDPPGPEDAGQAAFTHTPPADGADGMPTRRASATWEGGFQGGKGSFSGESGAIEAPYTAGSRFADAGGTNPEELLAAAEAACFCMALAGSLERAGTPVEYVHADAACTIEKDGDGFTITTLRLKVHGRVPGIDADAFRAAAEATKQGCPVSRALSGVEITVETELK